MLRRTIIPIAVAVNLSLSTVAIAQNEDKWKAVGEFGWLGVGKTQEIEKDHFYWVGEFSGTFFNDKGESSLFHKAGIKCPAWFDTDMNNKKTKGGGYCIITDLSGDQAYLAWQNEGTPGPGGRGPGTFQYTGGTGKYKEINGNHSFVGVTQVYWKDGTLSGYATWNR